MVCQTQQKSVVLIDVDDTIEDLLPAWCSVLNETHGRDVHPRQITEWDIGKFFPGLTKAQLYAPFSGREIWERIKPKNKAVKYVRQLMNDGYDVYLCTTTDYRNIRDKYDLVIRRYFPFISWSHVIVTSKKQLINADFLIDDGVHNLEGGNYTKILMTAPHNKKYDAETNGMYRVGNWKEAYKLIGKLSQRRTE